MHCESFMHRLQETLDARLDPASDARLCEHAQHCSDCRSRLADWAAVDAVWSGDDTRRRQFRPGSLAALAAAVATGLLGAWMFSGGDPVEDRVVRQDAGPVSPVVASGRALADEQRLEQVLTTVSRGELSRWADDAWRPVVEGLRPVTVSLSAAVRAFQPASLHLEKAGADPATNQVHSVNGATHCVDGVSAAIV